METTITAPTIDDEKRDFQPTLERELVLDGISGLLGGLFVASTIILFSFLQLLSAGDFEQWSESECRVPSSTKNFIEVLIPAMQINIVVIMLCCSTLLVQMVFQIGGLTITYWHRQMVVLISGVLFIMFTIMLCLMSYVIQLFYLTKFPSVYASSGGCAAVEAVADSASYWDVTMGTATYGEGWFWFALAGILAIFLWASCVVGPAQFRFVGDKV